MKYSDVRVDGDRIVVSTRELAWNPMSGDGPAASRDAASARVPVPGRAADTLVVEVGQAGHILEHAAAQDGLVFVMSGTGELGLPGREPLAFSAPALILVSANVPHWWDAGPQGFTMGVSLYSQST